MYMIIQSLANVHVCVDSRKNCIEHLHTKYAHDYVYVDVWPMTLSTPYQFTCMNTHCIPFQNVRSWFVVCCTLIPQSGSHWPRSWSTVGCRGQSPIPRLPHRTTSGCSVPATICSGTSKCSGRFREWTTTWRLANRLVHITYHYLCALVVIIDSYILLNYPLRLRVNLL